MDRPEIVFRTTVFRGRVENLEGTLDSRLFAWARFDLGDFKVLMHGLLVQPPELAEGDEVVVAGYLRRGRLDAKACFKPAETARQSETRRLRARSRRRFWITVAIVVSLLAIGSGFGFMLKYGRIDALPQAALLSMILINSYNVARSSIDQAELELALALERDEVQRLP